MRYQFTVWTFSATFITVFWFGTPLSRTGFGIWLYRPPPAQVIAPAIAPGVNDGPDFSGPRP